MNGICSTWESFALQTKGTVADKSELYKEMTVKISSACTCQQGFFSCSLFDVFVLKNTEVIYKSWAINRTACKKLLKVTWNHSELRFPFGKFGVASEGFPHESTDRSCYAGPLFYNWFYWLRSELSLVILEVYFAHSELSAVSFPCLIMSTSIHEDLLNFKNKLTVGDSSPSSRRLVEDLQKKYENRIPQDTRFGQISRRPF